MSRLLSQASSTAQSFLLNYTAQIIFPSLFLIVTIVTASQMTPLPLMQPDSTAQASTDPSMTASLINIPLRNRGIDSHPYRQWAQENHEHILNIVGVGAGIMGILTINSWYPRVCALFGKDGTLKP